MKTLELPDALYAAFVAAARAGGFASVAEYLADQHREATLARSRAAFARIDAERERILARTGVQPDSTPLIREDRDR